MQALIDIEHVEPARFDDIASTLRKAVANPRALKCIRAKPSSTADLRLVFRHFNSRSVEKALRNLSFELGVPSKSAKGAGELLALNVEREVRHDGEYVLTSGGSKDFGKITEEIANSIGRQAGKIRLRRGIEHERDNKGGYGEKHIEREGRKQQLEKAGYANARDFVENVCSNFNKVYQNGGGLLLVKETGRLVCAIGLESSKNGNFYDVKTAHIAREGYYKKKRLLWESPSNLHKSESSKAPTLKSSYATPRAFSEYPDTHIIPQSAKNASEISKKYQKIAPAALCERV